MISEEHYIEIRNKHGLYTSWAIWAEVGDKPKSNIGDMRIFNLEYNQDLLEQLNPNVLMVGLNFSRNTDKKIFGNFHDKSPQSQDYKIRYAFKNTSFYGAYMTDIIKNYEEKSSGKVISHLKTDKEFENLNIDLFKEELHDLKTADPLIIAFGGDTYSILCKHFGENHKIVKVPHYSMYINKEDYKRSVDEIMANI